MRHVVHHASKNKFIHSSIYISHYFLLNDLIKELFSFCSVFLVFVSSEAKVVIGVSEVLALLFISAKRSPFSQELFSSGY